MLLLVVLTLVATDSVSHAAPAGGEPAPASYLSILLSEVVLTRRRMTALKGLVAAAGTAVLLWGYWLQRRGRPCTHRRLRDALLLALGLLAGLCWWNLFQFHFRTYTHTWDTYHYYIGGKYFRELRYTRLYTCTVIADAEAGLVASPSRRLIRDLQTNELVGINDVLARPTECTRHFAPERWASFTHDVGWFRARLGPSLWQQGQHDHGYNGTPVWAILGTTLAGAAPASRTQILLLTLIDPAILVGMWALVARTFGWRSTCVALIYWGTNFPAHFAWTGGSYLRQDWLVLTVVGICLLKRRRPMAAGLTLSAAALLRILPGLIFAGPALKGMQGAWRERRPRLSTEHARLAIGGLLGLLVLGAASIAGPGDAGAWPEFLRNTTKHFGTPATNHIGLATLVAYEHETRARLSVPLDLEADRFQAWKDARQRVFDQRRFVFLGLALVFLALLARAVKDQADWVGAVLGVGMVPILAQPAGYYYSILLVFALLWEKRPPVGIALCALAALGSVVPEITPWYDEQSTLLSLLIVMFVAFATACCIGRSRSFDGPQQSPGPSPRSSSSSTAPSPPPAPPPPGPSPGTPPPRPTAPAPSPPGPSTPPGTPPPPLPSPSPSTTVPRHRATRP